MDYMYILVIIDIIMAAEVSNSLRNYILLVSFLDEPSNIDCYLQKNSSLWHCKFKLQWLPVNFYFVLYQYHMKRTRFSLVFTTYVQFCTQIVVLFKKIFSAAKIFSSHQKFGPHDHQHPVHCFPSHQQTIDLNDWQNIQYLPKNLSVF